MSLNLLLNTEYPPFLNNNIPILYTTCEEFKQKNIQKVNLPVDTSSLVVYYLDKQEIHSKGGKGMDAERTGKLLKELRGRKTLAEVANDLGISISALSMYENGERVPRDEVKKKIADYYSRSVQFLFFR
jgi:DNA-binding XRE family transcriptional regulator